MPVTVPAVLVMATATASAVPSTARVIVTLGEPVVLRLIVSIALAFCNTVATAPLVKVVMVFPAKPKKSCVNAAVTVRASKPVTFAPALPLEAVEE